MKKRLFSLILVPLLFVLFALPSLAADGAIPVSDPDSLRGMAAHPGDRFYLTCDIDMAGEAWTPFAFSGELDGGGHTIYNLSVTTVGEDVTRSVDGNLKEYDTVGAGLFSTLSGAKIHDLTLLNIRVEVETEQNCFIAPFAGCIASAEFENCSVSGSVKLTSNARMVGVGGIAGFGTGTFEGCSADVTLIHLDRNLESHCEQFTGGVLGCGYGSINHCSVNIAGYTSCHGYVHDGGLVGMHYQFFDTGNYVKQYSQNNRVTGFIQFFEHNWDRRAYCDAYCGENLYYTMILQDNEQSFERQEVFTYDTELLPHSCTEDAYTVSVTEPDCTNFGFTTYTCSLCGYSYTDNYVAPRHVPGAWEVITPATLTASGEQVLRCALCGAELEHQEIPPHVAGEWETATPPDYGVPGLEQLRCAECGELLEEREMPALVRTEMISLFESDVKLQYKGTTQLHATVLPSNADDQTLVWSSSNMDVASVDSNGTVFARGNGSTVITCVSQDGGAQAQCTVTVKYSFGQQLIRIFLLGFLWY